MYSEDLMSNELIASGEGDEKVHLKTGVLNAGKLSNTPRFHPFRSDIRRQRTKGKKH